MKRFLIIQTAHLGDVILALPVAQALRDHFPDAEIHFLVRKDASGLCEKNPAIDKIWKWDKKNQKLAELWVLIRQLRKVHFDLTLNLHRHFSSGLITAFVRGKEKRGFKTNPLSLFYSRSFPHQIARKKGSFGPHEVLRNLSLLEGVAPAQLSRPSLFIGEEELASAKKFLEPENDFVVIAPCSVWKTKEWPAEKWVELCGLLPSGLEICFIGGKTDRPHIERLITQIGRGKNLAGQLSLRESAALIKLAKRTFVNDSAPLHLASAVNAPVTAIFCSTIPEFGFGPLSEDRKIVEYSEPLDCRPCGLHGHSRCPKGHFKCAMGIEESSVLEGF